MSKLVTAKINMDKIREDLLFQGQSGKWLDLTIWINDTPDKFGYDISIEQRTKKDERKIFLGNGKFYVKKEEAPPANEPEKSAVVPLKTLPDANDEPDDLPF